MGYRKDGEVVKLAEPFTTHERRLFIIRDDGQIFGDVPDPKVTPMSELGLTVHLPEMPPDSRL